jgi:opacity protein-like surface antigen
MRTPATVLVAALALAAAPARAQPVSEPSGPDTYLELELGAFLPQASDLDGLDPGVAVAGTFGAMFTRHVGAEATIGYYRAATSTAGTERSLNVMPVLASLRLVAPLQALELSARAGVGLHLASTHVTGGGASAYDSATAFGYHVGGGAAFKLSPTMLVGVDLLATFASARFGGVETALDGLQVSVKLGYKL